VLGLSFKPGTDDLRESPIVHLVKNLIAEGCSVQIWDNCVSLGRLIGSNRQFIDEYIPHIGTLLTDTVAEVVTNADVVLLATNAISPNEVCSHLRKDQRFIDLTNLGFPIVAGQPVGAV
jgi:GDP-mannose 6-dehydrogenase